MLQKEIRLSLLLSLVYALRMYGLFLLLPVLTLHAADYKYSTAALIGLALGIYGLTQAFFQIPFGIISDSLGRKPIIIFGLLLVISGGLVAAAADSIYTVILGRAIQGAGAVAAALMALGADLCRAQYRSTLNAIVGAGIGFAFLAALITAPLLAELIGIKGIFYITSLFALLGILVIVLLVPTPKHPPIQKKDSLSRQRQLLPPQLPILCFGVFVLHAILAANFLVWPQAISAKTEFVGSGQWLFYLIVLGISFLVILPLLFYGEKRQKVKPFFQGAIILLVTVQIVSAGDLSAGYFLAVCCLFFVAFNYLEANMPSLVAKICSNESRGMALGIFSTAQFLGIFLGATTGGVFLQWEQFHWFTVLTVVLLLVWLILTLKMKTGSTV